MHKDDQGPLILAITCAVIIVGLLVVKEYRHFEESAPQEMVDKLETCR